MRRAALGLNAWDLAAFADSCTFIPLGSYCQVTNTIMALGLRKFSYPLDWNRSRVSGVIDLIESNFDNFFDCSQVDDMGEEGIRYMADWGGSFWHHDVEDGEVQAGLQRRIDRFYGRGEVAPEAPRVFLRSANSTNELGETFRLHSALQRALPYARIFLLVLVDLQDRSEVFSVAGPEGRAGDILFARVHQSIWREPSLWTHERQCDVYARALVKALRFWMSGGGWDVREQPSLQALVSQMNPFEAGDPMVELWRPRTSSATAAIAREEAQEEDHDDSASGIFSRLLGFA